MNIKGFELKARTAYDVLLVNSLEGENIFVSYAKIVYDSIKLNWKWFNRFWFRWKFSPSKLLKKLTQEEIIKAVKAIRILEGAKEKDLMFLDYQLGSIEEEKFIQFLEANKKKVQTIQDISKQ